MRRPGRVARGLLAACLALAGGCGPEGPAVHRLAGAALGTSWSLIVVDEDRSSTPKALEELVERGLDEVDRAASNWRADSELAAIAALAPGASLEISDLLRAILDEARAVHELSGGAFDPTVGPLVALFGFGAGAKSAPPSEEERAAAHARLGFDAFDWSADGSLTRDRAGVELDLSAVAKGFAVDHVAAALRARGETRFLFEVGGELVLSGTRASGDPWIVGIDEPVADPAPGPLGSATRPMHVLLSLEDAAVATSGDYRAFRFDAEGRRISHTIDPRTGRPAESRLASATVVAPTCARADALATAVMVLGAEEGLALLERLDGVEGMLLRHGDGEGESELVELRTRGFDAYVREP